MSTVVLDLDDAYPGNDRMELLSELRQQVPGLKVTLFAIPGRCTQEWLWPLLRVKWIQLVPHGWMHKTNRECQHWTRDEMEDKLAWTRIVGMEVRGFKAPGWQISDECYAELRKQKYWVMDQPYNNHRRPPGLRSFILGEPPPGVVQIHGHVGHLNGRNANELEYLVPEILKYRDAEWKFVSEVVR